ncbi:MAG: phage integrase SAM-like domain-containing protein, partial [Bacteroidota bacterium]
RDFIKALISQKVLAYQNKLVEDPQLGNSAEKIIQAVENTKTNQQFFPFLSELIDRLVQSGKIGNANVYKDTRRTLKNFTASSTILLTDIDQSFLSKYEAYLRGLGLADTSSSAYFRTLRAKTGKMIQFKLLAPARAIIEYYRPDTLCRQEDYILPILNKNVPITPTQIDHRLEKVLKSEVL